MQKKIEFLKTLPKKRIAVGVLLFNVDKKLLILKPGYKDDWTIPGGVVEELESPADAAKRESKEEIGLEIRLLKCLAVDFTKNQLEDYVSESLQIIFLGKKLSSKEIKNIKIDGKEIVDYKFVAFEEAISLLNPNLSKRLDSLSRDFKKFVFLENGKLVV